MKKLLLMVLVFIFAVSAAFSAEEVTDSIINFWERNNTQYDSVICMGDVHYYFSDIINNDEINFTIIEDDGIFSIGCTLKSYYYPKFVTELNDILAKKCGLDTSFIYAFTTAWQTALRGNPAAPDTYNNMLKYNGKDYDIEVIIDEEENIVSMTLEIK